MNISLIGYGYWGRNLLRNIVECKLFSSIYVFDIDENQAKEAKELYQQVIIAHSLDEILQNTSIEALIIATPPNTHFELIRKGLIAGKHIISEKPFCKNTSDSILLIEEAKKRDLILMIDHTFLYTGAVQKIKSLIEQKEIGDIKYIDSVRINLGLFQNDINVLWDLASHDISIINYILEEKPTKIQAIGQDHDLQGIENIAFLTLKYESGLIVHCNCSWISPVKIRQMIIGVNKKMILFNDIEPEDKVKVYDSGYEVMDRKEKERFLVEYRMGDFFTPKLDNEEALLKMIKDFHTCITEKGEPISHAQSGYDVIKILEAAELSFSKNSELIEIDW